MNPLPSNPSLLSKPKYVFIPADKLATTPHKKVDFSPKKKPTLKSLLDDDEHNDYNKYLLYSPCNYDSGEPSILKIPESSSSSPSSAKSPNDKKIFNWSLSDKNLVSPRLGATPRHIKTPKTPKQILDEKLKNKVTKKSILLPEDIHNMILKNKKIKQGVSSKIYWLLDRKNDEISYYYYEESNKFIVITNNRLLKIKPHTKSTYIISVECPIDKIQYINYEEKGIFKNDQIQVILNNGFIRYYSIYDRKVGKLITTILKNLIIKEY